MVSDPIAAQALADREVGQIKISIGTSLALEGAFGILEDNHNPNPVIHKTDVLYVNVRTLCRNLVGSMESSASEGLFAEDLAHTLITEMMVMQGAVQQFTDGRVTTRFYMPSYRGLLKRFPHAHHRKANTTRQQFAAMREENAMMELQSLLGQSHHNLDIFEIDIDLESDNRRALILTSYAIDLLQKYRFQTLTLLESHTGATKPPPLWHTKLTNGKNLPRIPFDRMTVQFFGDNGNLFSPYPIKARRVMQELSEKHKWTFTTTKDYIIQCLKKAYEPILEEMIVQLYRG